MGNYRTSLPHQTNHQSSRTSSLFWRVKMPGQRGRCVVPVHPLRTLSSGSRSHRSGRNRWGPASVPENGCSWEYQQNGFRMQFNNFDYSYGGGSRPLPQQQCYYPVSQNPWYGMYDNRNRSWQHYPTFPRPPPLPPITSCTQEPLDTNNKENNAYCDPDSNVEMTHLPFFRRVSLLKKFQTKGYSAQVFLFNLMESDMQTLKDKNQDYQVQVRVCLPNTSEEQKDYFPRNMVIEVNHKFLPLPGFESIPRGPARPIDITHLCTLSKPGNNFIKVITSENVMIQVSLVQRLTFGHLLRTIQDQGYTSPHDTEIKIREKLEGSQVGDEIASTTQRCSLLCPLSKTRMNFPCRATTCHHFQCFDVTSYLQMNERNPKWLCPVCFQPAKYKDLHIDGYFKEILDQNTVCDMVILTASGKWEPLQDEEKKKRKKQKQKQQNDKEKEVPEALRMEAAVTPSGLNTSCLSHTIVLDSDSEKELTTTNLHYTNSFHQGNGSMEAEKSVETIILSDDETCNTPGAFNFQSMYCSTPVSKETTPVLTRRSLRSCTLAPSVLLSVNNSDVAMQPVSTRNLNRSKRKRMPKSDANDRSKNVSSSHTTCTENSTSEYSTNTLNKSKRTASHDMVLRSSKRTKTNY
ncbi:hypothetical protein Pmani_018872 [Petrolisthes manimaculis]|uniref:E3 SUMO-protein ligase PIAS2 n=1 Tax=Petrolisthes manimaculis TaxID=1843537 RepID=A0AAE1PLN2_9EUCA|nr:hypothetical protein Pmani_018872 [Petrolisthes manimaculis]